MSSTARIQEPPPSGIVPVCRVDAVVLAGTRGTALFNMGSRRVGKPFLELGGEPLVRRVVRAVLDASRVRRVFVVGDPDLLAQALDRPRLASAERLAIVPEGEDILDNCYRAYFHHVLASHGLPPVESPSLDPPTIAAYRELHPEARTLPAIILTSDLPFLTGSELDRFLESASSEAALTLGLVNHRQLQRLRLDLGEQAVLEKWKLGALYLRKVSVRINNLFLVRPLLGQPVLYSLFAELYAHRWLLRQDGSIHWRNWWAIARAILRHFARVPNRLRSLRGLFNFVPEMIALCLARVTHRVGRWLSWPFRQFLRKRDLELIGSLLVGAPTRLAVSDDLGPALDIDVEETYRTLMRNGEENYRRMARYLGRLAEESVADNARWKVVAGGRL